MSEKRMKFRITVPGMIILGVALAFLGASFVHHVNLLLLLFTLIVATGFVGALFGRSQIQKLTVERSCPTLLPVGRPFTCLIEITNHGKRPAVGVQIVDQIDSGTAVLPVVSVESVNALQTERTRYEWIFAKRGVYRLGPMKVLTSYPFGFVTWSRPLENSCLREPVVVHPPIGRLSVQAKQHLGIACMGEGKSRTGLREGIDEFRGVREFRDGDSPKLIHWRSTARRGTLVVRELDPAASRSLLMLVYLVDPTGHVSQSIVDSVLSFASTVVVEVCRDPMLQLTVLIVGKEPALVRGSASSTRIGTYLRALAAANSTASPEALEQACHLLRTADMRDRRLWIVSLADVPTESQNRLRDSGFRRVSTRMMLNASAGDLDRMWIVPTSSPPNISQTMTERLGKNGLISPHDAPV